MDKRKNQDVLEKEVDLIQSCINRMAQNSFFVKGWMISLLVVIIGVLHEKIDINLLCSLAIVIALCFWYLDGFFLKTEKLFRLKYEWVISNRYDSDMYFYDLNPYNKNMWIDKTKDIPCVISVMFSKTLLSFYSIIILAFAILLICNNHISGGRICFQNLI